MAHFQGLLEHEARLRHGAFGGIHQQQHPVHHVHDAFHLPAEIRMAGSIHDVDLDGLAGDRVRDGDGGIFGQDGDAALAFEVIGVHHALGHLLVVAEGMRLAQQPVHQGGLPVVDVGDDCNIAEIGSFFQHSSTFIDWVQRLSKGDKKPRPEGAEARLERDRRISANGMYFIRLCAFCAGGLNAFVSLPAP